MVLSGAANPHLVFALRTTACRVPRFRDWKQRNRSSAAHNRVPIQRRAMIAAQRSWSRDSLNRSVALVVSLHGLCGAHVHRTTAAIVAPGALGRALFAGIRHRRAGQRRAARPAPNQFPIAARLCATPAKRRATASDRLTSTWARSDPSLVITECFATTRRTVRYVGQTRRGRRAPLPTPVPM